LDFLEKLLGNPGWLGRETKTKFREGRRAASFLLYLFFASSFRIFSLSASFHLTEKERRKSLDGQE
jgi:hypothetical protein